MTNPRGLRVQPESLFVSAVAAHCFFQRTSCAGILLGRRFGACYIVDPRHGGCVCNFAACSLWRSRSEKGSQRTAEGAGRRRQRRKQQTAVVLVRAATTAPPCYMCEHKGQGSARHGTARARQGICDFTKNVQKHVQMMTNTNAPPFQRQTAKAAHNSRMQEHLLHDCASGSGAPRPVVLPSSPSFVQPFLMRNFTMIRRIFLFIPSGRALTGTAQSQDVRRLRARWA